MRKVTRQAIDAFMNGKKFRSSNTSVEVLPNVTILKLHGNEIAYRYNDPERTLTVTTAYWNTVTTRDRLNGIPGVSVWQKRGKLYLNGQKWDGSLTDVK
jgi:hypothetical protein